MNSNTYKMNGNNYQNNTQNVNTKSYKYLIYMLAVVALSVFSALSGDIITSIIISGIGGGFFAGICLNKFKVWTVGLVSICSPALSFFLTQSLEKTVLSLSFLPVGIAVFLGMKKGYSRSQTIVRGIFAETLYYAAVFSSYVYHLFGSISSSAFRKYIELNLNVVRMYMEQVKQIYIQNNINVKELFKKEVLDELIESLRVTWLGYGFMLFGIFTFVSTVIAKSTIPTGKAKEDFEKKVGKWSFVFSKAGAAVFVMAYMAASLYSAEKEGLYLALALNGICLGMYPGLIYMGGLRIIEKLKTERKTSYLISLVIAFAVFGKYVMLLLVIFGIFSAFTYKEKSVQANT